MKFIYLSVLMIFSIGSFADNKAIEIDSNQIQINGYVHKSLSEDLLLRIKVTTDTFEIVDGMSYLQVVDLYKRDLDPESNLVIWEEMARMYNIFCESRCRTAEERMDVYRTLLLRSMFSDVQSMARLQLKVISTKEAVNLISQYRLEAKPIDVVQQ